MEVLEVKNALLSVSEKLGLVSFAAGLRELGVELYATGGTRQALLDAGVDCHDLAGYTGYPEMLDGRVKTLHPKVHAGILARRDLPHHMQQLDEHQIVPFDLVVVNLYPFRQTVGRKGCALPEAIEQIDIGGPTLIRAAAKNHSAVAVVTDPGQYAGVLQELKERGGIRLETRRRLAIEAFQLTASYDRAIARYLDSQLAGAEFPSELVCDYRLRRRLRYGENPHQQAALYVEAESAGPAIATAHQLHGKELSFNNILDLDSALAVVRDFAEPAAVVIKHTNPCGAAQAATLREAFLAAYEGDPLSAFGSVLGFNRELDAATAEAITEPGRFIEAIIAPRFSDEALHLLTTRPKWKANVRLVQVGELEWGQGTAASDYRKVSGGVLVQSADVGEDPREQWQVVTQRQPNEQELRDLAFAWKLVRHVKSNAIVLAKQMRLVGVGAGQMSRVDAVELAVRKAGDRAAGSVLASDAFFPFRDGPEAAAAAGVSAIIQPGGSRRDAEVIQACNEHNMAMIFTGRRHFRH